MRCAACGEQNGPGARFCSACGHALAARGDERRVVTVVFADLVGFTHLSEVRDPEQVKELVDRCFERLAVDITAFGGVIDKIVGDAILALFGAPVAHEDDAERAVRAALRMQHSVRAYAEDAAAEIRMRVGVNTGEVLVGSLRAGGDYTAMGDVVNTAQRLQAAAEPGTVLVGAATHGATAGVIEYRDAGLVQAKGRDEPVQAYVALEPLLPPGHRRRHRAAPFVGRDTELGTLRNAAQLTAVRSRAQLVVVAGEAGVGKSRLAEEVAAEACTALGALVLEGRCVPYGEANVWWPLAEAIRSAMGGGADEDAGIDAARVGATVATALDRPVDDAEVERVALGLRAVLGHETALRGIDPANARVEVERAVLAFVGGLARTAPVVLVLSDLHWADDVVLEVIGALLDRLARSPVLVLATTRGELLGRWAPPLGRHNTLVLNLDPLDAASAGALLTELVPGALDDALASALLDRSGGNPFFLEELVALLGATDLRSAADTGDPRAVGVGRHEGSGGLHVLPDTLRGLVAARLDALDPAARAVLDNAAVWGRSGPVLALEAMCDSVGLGDVATPIAVLEDLELLVVDDTRWRFRSDLVREVAYGTLTKADRARRHVGIAAHLERTTGAPDAASDRTADVIAFHYAAAAELAAALGLAHDLPTDLPDRAARWLEEAAARAWRARLHPVAARLYDQGVALLDGSDDERRCRFLLGSARAHAELRDLQLARERVEAATVLAAATGDASASARALLALGDIEQKAGQTAASAATLDAAAAALGAAGEPIARAEALRLRGLSLLMAGDNRRAEASITEALEAYRELDDAAGAAWALQNLAWIAYLQGEAASALARLETAEGTFAELGDGVGLSWVRGLLAFVRYHLGDFAAAEDLGEQVLLDARQRGDRWGEGMMLLLVSGVRLWSGRAPTAVIAARDALELFRRIGDRLGEAQALGFLARAEVLSGDVAAGVDLLTEAIDRSPTDGVPVDEHQRLLAIALAGAAVQLGDVGLAERALAAVQFEDLSPRDIGDVDVLVARGLSQLQRGRVEEAHELLLVANDTGEDVEPSAYARAALALAAAVNGATAEAAELVEVVLAANRATYADRHLALLARVVLAVRAGLPASVELAALQANLHGIDDAVSHAVVALVEARTAELAGDPDAASARARADAHLGAIGVDAAGWTDVLELAVAASGSR